MPLSAEAFAAGLERLLVWTVGQPDMPSYEPINLFGFRN